MKKHMLLLSVIGILIVAAGVIAFLLFSQRKNSLLPQEVQAKINFPVYVPDASDVSTTQWYSKPKDVSYDNETGVLTIVMHKAADSVIFKQQATPDAFKDIPDYYNKLLDKLQQYAEVTTNKGTVTLTRPKELNGQQSASANPLGTLIFATPNRNLNNQEWTALFNDLNVIK